MAGMKPRVAPGRMDFILRWSLLNSRRHSRLQGGTRMSPKNLKVVVIAALFLGVTLSVALAGKG